MFSLLSFAPPERPWDGLMKPVRIADGVHRDSCNDFSSYTDVGMLACGL